MLLFQNVKHKAAFIQILATCKSVAAYDVTHEYNFTMVTVLGGTIRHDDISYAMSVIWREMKTPIRISLGGAYYATIKPTINGKHAAFDLLLTSNDKRKNTSLHIEHYNVIGGYWYTPQHELNKTGVKALESNLMASLTEIVRAFNRRLYIRR